MGKFVCVRIPQANDIDLTKFQFDYDLTFAAFFMNADGTIYGRFGTRSSREEATEDITLEGFAESLAGALKLHERYPANKQYLAAKQGQPIRFKTPNDLPALRGKYKAKIEYGSQSVKSCMHCHQISDAERLTFRTAGKPIPDKLLYPYPMPDVIGIELNARTRATVSEVKSNSAADRAGLKTGDKILTANGQAILALADVQWVLHHAEDTDQFSLRVLRDNNTTDLTVKLESGWRRATDIAWRVSSWDLRRMGTGGLLVTPATGEDRRQASVDDSKMALLVKHVGQYGAHAVAKKAGFQKGDVIISFDGQSDLVTDSALLGYAAQHTKPGDKINVVVKRGAQRLELKLLMQ